MMMATEPVFPVTSDKILETLRQKENKLERLLSKKELEAGHLDLTSARLLTMEANLQNDKSTLQEADSESRKLKEKVNRIEPMVKYLEEKKLILETKKRQTKDAARCEVDCTRNVPLAKLKDVMLWMSLIINPTNNVRKQREAMLKECALLEAETRVNDAVNDGGLERQDGELQKKIEQAKDEACSLTEVIVAIEAEVAQNEVA